MRKLTGESFERIAKAFRHPDTGLFIVPLVQPSNISIESAVGRLIRSQITPCIAFLREKYPLKLRLVFPTSFLSQFCPPSQIQSINCTDISYTDNLFDRFVFK